MESIVEDKKIGAEVYKVLTSVPQMQYQKIPLKIRKEFEKYKEYGKGVEINYTNSFAEQPISKKAKDIVFAISFNYWLTNEEKKYSLNQMKKNEQELLRKYNQKNLFKNDIKDRKIETSTAPISYKKENIVKVLLQKIKKILKIK